MPRTRQELEKAAEAAADWIESLDPDSLPWQDAAPLRDITAAFTDVAAAEQRLAEAVARARAQDFSWNLIGIAMDISGEAARQRFGKAGDEAGASGMKMGRATTKSTDAGTRKGVVTDRQSSRSRE